MKLIHLTLLLASFSFYLLPGQLQAEDDNVEYKVKAGYLFNFTKFITWPNDDSGTFNICIVGQDPFGPLIDPIEKRTAFDLPIKLFRSSTLIKSQRCHIVFIGAENKEELIEKGVLLARDLGKSLSVGEGDAFAESGGMIGFVNRDGRIKLQINMRALQKSGLTVSAKLLEIAEIVGGGGHE